MKTTTTNTNGNYATMSDEELLLSMRGNLTTEQNKTIDNMGDGLFLSLQLLDQVKEVLVKTYIETLDDSNMRTVEWVQDYLSKGLARAKEVYGSSLAVNKNNQELYLWEILPNVKMVDVEGKDRFKWMANLDDVGKTANILKIKATLDLILDLLSQNGIDSLTHLDQKLVLEIKTRLSGKKPLSHTSLANKVGTI